MAEDFENRRVSRRGFFREALAGLVGPVVELFQQQLDFDLELEETLPPLRPPGAAPGDAFAQLCSACGDCAEACPAMAVVLDPLPQIKPADKPCALCEDLPCIAACKTSALQPTRPEEVSMGLAVWDSEPCLLGSGRSCSACVDACPVAGAIRIDQGTVAVDGARCRGCGTCEYYCPARPRAVTIEAF